MFLMEKFSYCLPATQSPKPFHASPGSPEGMTADSEEERAEENKPECAAPRTGPLHTSLQTGTLPPLSFSFIIWDLLLPFILMDKALLKCNLCLYLQGCYLDMMHIYGYFPHGQCRKQGNVDTWGKMPAPIPSASGLSTSGKSWCFPFP